MRRRSDSASDKRDVVRNPVLHVGSESAKVVEEASDGKRQAGVVGIVEVINVKLDPRRAPWSFGVLASVEVGNAQVSP